MTLECLVTSEGFFNAYKQFSFLVPDHELKVQTLWELLTHLFERNCDEEL